MTNPLVSIIIHTYNRANLIGETLDSVLAQTYTNWECIVVDDGSTDETEELVNNYIAKDLRFQYHHRPDKYSPGGNGARNFGFALSKGEFVQWFDDDDIMLENYLNSKVLAFNPLLELVICSGSYVKMNLSHIKLVNINLSTFLFKDYVFWQSQILTPSVLFRKSFLKNKILFSEKIFSGQETEFFSRLFFKLPSNTYFIINKPLFLYRQHSKTKSYERKVYNSKYKASKISVVNDNLDRSLLLNDIELINYFSNILINLFFGAIHNNDRINAKYILNTYPKLIKRKDRSFAKLFEVFGNYIYITKTSIYRLEQYFKMYHIND